MTREKLIRGYFNRDMRLLEIGPSYNPIVPKADGWQTTIIDHATQTDLVAKYTAMGVATVDRVEAVDYVWQDGPLTALIPPGLHGSYDGLVASHVGEHFPDLIAFFKNASALIKPDGMMALALPDKRVCFDFFQPLSTTGDVVDAHLQGKTRHQRRTFFNQGAYFVSRGGEGGWAHSGNTAPFHLANTLKHAQKVYDETDESPTSAYRDNHAWTFTPKSFELLVLELNLLGHIDWAIRAIEPAAGVEFFVWLEKKRLVMPEAAVNPLRLELLSSIVRESKDAIAQLDEVVLPASGPEAVGTEAVQKGMRALKPGPSIAVVIPLYNGARYLEQALDSVLRQSLPATEIIVVNDGSTDDGAGVAIVERLAQRHALTLLQKPNGGQSSARNFGVHHAKSDLIAFLDQDDLWYENHLQELVEPFRTPSVLPLGWVYSNLDEIDEHGFLICRSFLSTMPAVHPKRHIADCIRQDMFILPSASLICRKAFLALGGFDERLCGYEDDDLFLRLFRSGYNDIYLDRSLLQWRIYPGSTSYSYRMAVSRNIYARKLLDMFRNDTARGGHYARDLIVPRFFDPAVRDYEAALVEGDPDATAAAWDELVLLAKHNDSVAPQLFRQALRQYRATLLKGDTAGITAAWSEVADAAARIPNKSGRLRILLNLLRNPTVSKSAFALRRVARPAMLWAFRA